MREKGTHSGVQKGISECVFLLSCCHYCDIHDNMRKKLRVIYSFAFGNALKWSESRISAKGRIQRGESNEKQKIQKQEVVLPASGCIAGGQYGIPVCDDCIG